MHIFSGTPIKSHGLATAQLDKFSADEPARHTNAEPKHPHAPPCPLKTSSKNSFLLIRVSNNFFLDSLSSKHDGIDPERTTYDPLVSPFHSRPPSSQREPNKGNCSGVQSSAPHLPSCDTALTTVNGPAPVPPGLIFSLARLFSLCYRLRPYLLADPFSADCVPRHPLIRLAALRFWLSSRRPRNTTPRR